MGGYQHVIAVQERNMVSSENPVMTQDKQQHQPHWQVGISSSSLPWKLYSGAKQRHSRNKPPGITQTPHTPQGKWHQIFLASLHPVPLYWKLKKLAMLHLPPLPENSTLQGSELNNPLQLAVEEGFATVSKGVIAENPLSTKELPKGSKRWNRLP